MACQKIEIYPRVDNIDFDFYNLHFTTLSLIEFVEKMKVTSDPISYVRIGDAEWRIILEDRGNIEQENLNDLGDRLRNVVDTAQSDDKFVISFSFKLFRCEHIHDRVVNYINQANPAIMFAQDDMFAEMTRYAFDTYMTFLEDVLRGAGSGRKVCLVGNSHMDSVNPFDSVTGLGMFNPDHKIYVPKRNCYTQYDRIKSEIIQYATDNPGEQILFLLAMGPAAVIMVHDLHHNHGFADNHWLIDIGSFMDIFAGFASRTPHQCMKQDIYDMYTPCFLPSFTSTDMIRDISPSLL